MNFKTFTIGIPVLALLSACVATTSFQAAQPDVVLKINKTDPITIDSAPPQTYNTTSFGQYIFEASRGDEESMYGLIPLKFNGGYLAADILFFAPAMFFNLREVYPYYEFDITEGVVRYKKRKEDSWVTYTPTPIEIERAKNYFN